MEELVWDGLDAACTFVACCVLLVYAVYGRVGVEIQFTWGCLSMETHSLLQLSSSRNMRYGAIISPFVGIASAPETRYFQVPRFPFSAV